MKRTLTLLAAALAIGAGCLSLPASAHPRDYYDGPVVRVAPPPPRYEPVPPPRRWHFWVPGHWRWNGYRHYWVPGHWERERHGWHYRAPYWEQGPGGAWHYRDHRWER